MTPSSAADAWTGRLVGGRWRILSLLDDSGGMASVYLARDERLERQAVVKMPKASHLNEEFAERFAREAKWHAKVENLHVVHILDRGEEAGTPFLVLQYLPGGNLKSWCERNPSMLADPRLHYEAWLLPIAQALDAVAAQGIVHRDVKPSNILFDAGGQAYLSDFGIVKAGNDATMTGTGMFIGTLQFMSPEQCQNERVSLDGRSDQFGLAVTVYQVLTGWKYPTADDTAVVYAAKFGYTPMTQPVAHDPRIPQAVNDAVMRALATDREGRFASSVAFAKAVLAGFAGAGRMPEESTDASGSTGGTPPAPPRERQSVPVKAIPRPTSATERPVAAAVDTAPHRPGPRAGAASGRPGRLPGDQPRHGGSSGPAAAWTAAKLVVAGAIAVALLAGAYLLGGGSAWNGGRDGPQREGDAGVTVTTPPTPRVTAVRLAAGGPFKMGDDVRMEVMFSRPVRVTGRPRIEFTVGGESTRREAVFVDGDGTDRLSFLFEVPDSIDGTGIMLCEPPSIDTADAAIADAATGDAADLALEPPAAFAAVRIDGVWPRVPPVREPGEVVENSLGMKLVVIPAGNFKMGSNDGKTDEQPPHTVQITRPFLLGQTEVTQGQFERVMGTTPWRGQTSVKDGPTVAASYVSWADAVEFCRTLTEIERRAGRLSGSGVYRLPTEAEWEYACRAGTKTQWSFGEDESRLGDYAWWGGIVGNGNSQTEPYAHEVGSKQPNPWNLSDMHGNVWEWCSDAYDEGFYQTSPAADPKGPDAGSFRVIRGGGWNYGPVGCRSAYRSLGAPTDRNDGLGFRVVCELE